MGFRASVGGRAVEKPLYERAVFGERSDYPLPAGYGYRHREILDGNALVYEVVREQTENVQQVPASVFEEFRAFAKYLQENPDAKIRAWRGREHGATLESDLAKRMLGKLLADNVAELYAKLSNTRSFGLDGFSVNLKSCYKITLAVKCFLPLLEKFKEEDNRSTNPNKVSYNRMLLISRIVYFFGYTDNPKFLDNDESISGIWTSYKDKEWTTVGANFR